MEKSQFQMPPLLLSEIPTFEMRFFLMGHPISIHHQRIEKVKGTLHKSIFVMNVVPIKK